MQAFLNRVKVRQRALDDKKDQFQRDDKYREQANALLARDTNIF